VEFETEDHYARLATSYDGNWGHSPEYVDWMSRQLDSRLRISAGDRVVDVGAGTGLFLRALGEHVSSELPVVCVDPSRPMLDRQPDDPRLTPLQATAEQVASGEVRLPYDEVDAVLVKEVIHHVPDIAATIGGLADLLAPAARFLVVSLPPRLDYPLFTAALERFAKRQPEPESIAESMREAGLRVQLEYDEFPVRVDRDHYLSLVQRRWMSVLSTFSDTEIADGLAEIRERHPEPELTFTDRFAFVLGVRA
jgi:ubiquinone/menaquinone biosynthesis C-methylase UbiE